MNVEWLRSLVAGDLVMAGAGMHAELRGTYLGVDGLPTGGAVVRLLGWDGHRWWGHDHASVPWSTIEPWRGGRVLWTVRNGDDVVAVDVTGGSAADALATFPDADESWTACPQQLKRGT